MPAHLVGHSFGGALAIHIAQNHPQLVASLCLYEPTAFNLLKASQKSDIKLAIEIEALSQSIASGIDQGNYTFAAHVFTEFWGGLGAWDALDSRKQEATIGWVAKAPVDFSALLGEAPDASLPGDIAITLICGQHTHPHTRRISQILTESNPHIRNIDLPGANNLGPCIFREKVADLVFDHIAHADFTPQPSHA
ncbi:alpha/beta fold hydrolase [Rhodobacteraceae bacterium R_SAG10]|nr:alpha/beta fold hydrolase [Rhodobacteraceae bacterium R_SAG10]